MFLLGAGACIQTLLCLVLLPKTLTTPVTKFDVKEDGSNINKTVATSLLRSSSYILNLLAKAYPDGSKADLPLDCEDVLSSGQNKSGVYRICPKSRITIQCPLDVYCDMDTDGGGWTVIQRRGNFRSPQDFFQEWQAYKAGFGNIERDFWLGNDKIYALSNQKLCSARFDLQDAMGNRRYALYDTFWIDDEDHQYTLHIDGYSGDAGDSMVNAHNKQKFSTKDRKNDKKRSYSCAEMVKGGWWYNKCYLSNLNGLYLRGIDRLTKKGSGVHWLSWKRNYESLTRTEIKMRSRDFKKR